MRSRLLGEYREVGDGPAPSGRGRERQPGRWREGPGGPSLASRSGTRPPNLRRGPALAAPTFSRRFGLRSRPPPPPAPIRSLLRPRPSTASGGTGIHQGQSAPRSSGPAANPLPLEAGLLQCHRGSSRGPKIPFVWEEPDRDGGRVTSGRKLFPGPGLSLGGGLAPPGARFCRLPPSGGVRGWAGRGGRSTLRALEAQERRAP